ncbi:hypothetical protein O181_029712 [Austropuccinia psidii MF-1]|uniref:RRM domain-containing protein n=1 Tax=Austropuccinia psidii MF-1 TaxID=1389203 RepID=A0A9Q3CUB6_9BASI|nr:hypothetical protein [Austropuccinia psidii MF-1]
MLDQLFLHLVQYADELKNSSRPSIECGVFKSLENIHISQTNEPSLTLEYRTPAPIDFSMPQSSSQLPPLKSTRNFEEIDPLDCLKYSSEFHFEACFHDSSVCLTSVSDLYLSGAPHEGEATGSIADSSFIDSSEEADPFFFCSPQHSRTSSENCVGDETTSKFSLDPFGDPLFRDCSISKEKRIMKSLRGYETMPLTSTLSDKSGNTHSQTHYKGEMRCPSLPAISGDSTISAIPSMESASILTPTNVFVANFPSHWSKSDLWDLFEGIPVATVHVLPEKRVTGDEPACGGTGITRASDAQALLSMLDKKIWLIDGSALKFRLANSSPPSEPVNFHPVKKNRTIRRHQHKVIGRNLFAFESYYLCRKLGLENHFRFVFADRLRAEQTVGNKQIGACDRHQIVVYKNTTSSGPEGATLSVVHGSRHRSGLLGCISGDASQRSSASQRPLLDFLRAQLSRRNNYNCQQTVSSTVKQFTTVPPSLRVSQTMEPTKLPVGNPAVRHGAINPTMPVPAIPLIPLPLPLTTMPQPRLRILEVQHGPEGLTQRIAYVPRAPYCFWPVDSQGELSYYTPLASPYSLGWGPSIEPGFALYHSQAALRGPKEPLMYATPP